MDAFAPLLPGKDRDGINKLLLDPLPYVDAEIAARRTSGLLALIKTESIRNKARLIRGYSDLALTDILDDRRQDAMPAMRLGEPFRIEFPLDRRFPYAFAVQNVGTEWGGLTLSHVGGAAAILVPRLNTDGAPAFMMERTSIGHHRFVCFQAAQPFPAVLNEYVADSIAFDKWALGCG